MLPRVEKPFQRVDSLYLNAVGVQRFQVQIALILS